MSSFDIFPLGKLAKVSQQRKEKMKEKIKTTNPYSGESTMLTPEEHKLYHRIKNLELAELYDEMQQGLDKFSRMNPKAYMVLLD